MTPAITAEMVQEMEAILRNRNRVELLIEQGKIVIVEIKRKAKFKK